MGRPALPGRSKEDVPQGRDQCRGVWRRRLHLGKKGKFSTKAKTFYQLTFSINVRNGDGHLSEKLRAGAVLRDGGVFEVDVVNAC